MAKQPACLLIAAILLAGAPLKAQSLPGATGNDSAVQQGGDQPMLADPNCAALSRENPSLAPISSLCRFAVSYRRKLPDFICEQTTTSAAEGARRVQTTMHARVTYEKGRNTYSDVTVNGKPVETKGAAPTGLYSISTAGEFGSDLVGLFTPPVLAEFRFRKQAAVDRHPAVLYDFHLAASKNKFWTVGSSSNGTFNPEVSGDLWLDPQNARLLRMRIQPLHLPDEFPIAFATTAIDFGQVSLGEAGAFLLPVRSETHACLRRRGYFNSNIGCVQNVVTFQNCRKFAARARIVGDPQPPQEESLPSPSASK